MQKEERAKREKHTNYHPSKIKQFDIGHTVQMDPSWAEDGKNLLKNLILPLGFDFNGSMTNLK